jgi:D-alanine-D-alanine ligase-like ATP-grasp enzyme
VTVLLTVDWRESEGVFGDSVRRTRLLMERLEDAGENVELVNINSPAGILRGKLADQVVVVQADTPPVSAFLPPRYRVPHGFRLWLERNGLAFTGSRFAGVRKSSTFCKSASRAALRRCGIAVPTGMLVGKALEPVIRRLGLPMVVKQARETGCGVGIHMVDSLEILREVVDWHAGRGQRALSEEFVAGREFTVWVIERHGRPRAYGLIEFSKPRRAPLLDQGAKIRMRAVDSFTDDSRFWPEARFTPDLAGKLRAQLERAAVGAHMACGLRHYSRVDMIATESGPVVLDVNASPELDNWLEGVAETRGESVPKIIHHLVREATRA